MIAEFSITPLNADHMSQDVARAIETLRETGLEYRLGPMSTCVEGELDQVLAAIYRCHQTVANNYEHVVTRIVLDDDKRQSHSLAEMVPAVEQQLEHAAPPG